MKSLRPDVASAEEPERAAREFHCFMLDFSPTLLRGAYLLLNDASLAEDAVQSTMLRVFRRWDHAQTAPHAYSRRALVSVCRDQWRRQQRRLIEIPAGMTPIASDEVSFTEAVERRQALDQAMDALPSTQREVLVLRFYFELSVAEAAELLEVAEGTVKSATHRGLEQLRELLSSSQQIKSC